MKCIIALICMLYINLVLITHSMLQYIYYMIWRCQSIFQ
ncbi:unnamed protein product [Nippostrongylus brasiliensis]|uniref:CPXV167 protein n=1 Tax=Nippostrongylus brasiliensis TaxID=27835 RepID=A0A0N4YVK6_NIPBR|nr:unnamed protein product [Nippostrongylus brasiliensis]